MNSRPIDEDKLRSFSGTVWGYKQGEMVSLMIQIGDRLGIYKALYNAGPVTAGELAAKTQLKERWLFEWLRGQAAARILEYHGEDRFELSPEGAMVLSDEENSLSFAAGAFSGGTPPETVDKIVDAFRTGVGLSYEDLGPNAAHRTERMLGPWTKQEFVPRIIPALRPSANWQPDRAMRCFRSSNHGWPTFPIKTPVSSTNALRHSGSTVR